MRHEGSPRRCRGAPRSRRWLAANAAVSFRRPRQCQRAIAELIKGAEEKNAAFMRGDMDRWSKLTRIASDFTLMQPFGGPASHGFDTSPKRLAELAQYFRQRRNEIGSRANLCVGRACRSRHDRAAACRGWWLARPGLVIARNRGLSQRRDGVAIGASSCRSTRPPHHPRASGGSRARSAPGLMPRERGLERCFGLRRANTRRESHIATASLSSGDAGGCMLKKWNASARLCSGRSARSHCCSRASPASSARAGCSPRSTPRSSPAPPPSFSWLIGGGVALCWRSSTPSSAACCRSPAPSRASPIFRTAR